ncbi:MAG: amino acid adenylation domain-containing protein [Candidatus Marithrix sp.]
MSTIQALPEWNNTKTDYPQNKCIHQLFEEQVEKTPDAIAVVFEDQLLTYRELNNESNKLAHYLINLEVKPETLVGICIERSLEMVIGLLGILKAGGAYVPLDPSYPQERLSFMLKDTQVKILLTQQHLIKTFPTQELKIICLDTDCEIVSKQIETNPNNNVKPENLAYVIYTSGSTGKPKGIQIIHSAVVNFLTTMRQRPGLNEHDVLLAVTTMSFDISVLELYLPLIVGAKLILVSREIAGDGSQLLETMINSNTTIMQATPATWHLLIAAGWDYKLNKILVGGEDLSKELANQLLKESDSVWNMYGPTEATVWTTVCDVGAYHLRLVTTVKESIGHPIANIQIYILNKQMQQIPIGTKGELHIGGVGLARGYLNRPELTTEKFVPNPFSDEINSRLYKTGDLARYLPDGNIEYLGRIDNQVKIRGFRIELGEIETKLHQHPDIRDAVVIAREDTPGEKKLVAYLVVYQLAKQRVPMHGSCSVECLVNTGRDNKIQKVHTEDISYGGIGISGLKDDCQLGQRFILSLNLPSMQTNETLKIEGNLVWLGNNGYAGIQFDASSNDDVKLRNAINNFFEQQGILKVLENSFIDKLAPFLLNTLPDYMVPAHFIILDNLPLTLNGKVDRKALPVPDLTRPDLYTAVEDTLTKIWAEILGLERVGLHDNFLRLGGNSLLATKIISQINELFQLELPLYALFESPTIAELAEQVETPLHESVNLQIPPIESVANYTNIPLSFAQQQLWLLAQIIPDIPVYNEPLTIRLGRPIDIVVLEKCINEVLCRHDSLRTTFTTDKDGQPIQVISLIKNWDLPIVDLSEFPANTKEDEYIRLATQSAKQPFDLVKGPLFRAILFRLNEADYRLCLTLHHIIFDGVSLYNVLFPELITLYQDFVSKKLSPLPELSIQYADYAIWQQKSLPEELLEQQLTYWKQQLANLPTLQLPLDRPRSVLQTYKGARHCLVLSKEITTAIKELSQQEKVTPFMTLLAAFNILLYRYSGQDDISIGTVTAGRNHAELDDIVGMFLNTLVLRTDLSGNPNFKQLLQRVGKIAIEAYSNEDLPFELLVKALHPERKLNINPFFQVAFILEPSLSKIESNWTINQYDIHTGTSKFDLTISLDERHGGIIGRIEYNTDLFDETTIIRMIDHYKCLLEGIIANPEQPIAQLPLLTKKEQQQLQNWNKSPLEMCIHQLFEAQVKRTPNAIAVVFEEQQLTYQELNNRANQLANYLIKLGVEPEILVGVCIERSIEMIVGIFGILKAGGAYVPLDPTYPQERLSFMLEDSKIKILLTQQHLRKLIPIRLSTVIRIDSEWKDIAQEETKNPDSKMLPSNLAYVIYTSGSTGKPKGVLLEHRGLCNLSIAQINAFGIHADSRVLQFASLNFDASISEIVMALISGATLCLGTKDTLLPDSPLLQFLQEKNITVATLPPSILVTLPSEKLPNLQTIIVAGEICSPELVTQYAPERHFFNAYGPTEATVCTTIAKCIDDGCKPPIGHPIVNTQVYILDKYLQQVPIGVIGELHVAGINLARGYLNRPKLTAEKFISNPFSDDSKSRLYKTGDLARYYPDGNIEFLGRIDYQVKVRGFRIELEEIETVLMQHPQIQDAIVIVREDILDDKRLIAYFITHNKSNITELRHFLAEQIPDYMIPSAFIALKSFPFTPNGKVDRKALPKPGKLERDSQTIYVAPQVGLEQSIANIWQELLQLKEVGIEDTFFDLGGHSLLIVQLQERLNKVLNKTIPVTTLFQYPTIKTLVQHLNSKSESNTKSNRVSKRQAAILRQKARKTR